MRKHTRKLIIKLGIVGVIVIAVVAVLAALLLRKPDVQFELIGKVVKKSKWEETFRNDQMFAEWLAWLELQEDEEKPYFSIKVEEVPFQDGLLEWTDYHFRIIRGEEGEVLATTKFSVKPAVLEERKAGFVSSTVTAALITGMGSEGGLLRHVADEGLKTPFAQKYLYAIAQTGPKGAAALPQLINVAVGSSDAELQASAAKAVRHVQPADAAGFPATGAEKSG